MLEIVFLCTLNMLNFKMLLQNGLRRTNFNLHKDKVVQNSQFTIVNINIDKLVWKAPQ